MAIANEREEKGGRESGDVEVKKLWDGIASITGRIFRWGLLLAVLAGIWQAGYFASVLEPLAAIATVIILGFLMILVHGLSDESPLIALVVLTFMGATFLYASVRFVKWAWDTPMPFGQ